MPKKEFESTLIRIYLRKSSSQSIKNSFSTPLGAKRTFNYKHPGYAGNLIINFASIPSLPNLISQFLIKGFYVDFGEHGLRVACS